jgi:hypothetical protein
MNNQTNSLPTSEYCWQTWDCFTLAYWVRNQYSFSVLPNLDWLYQKYDETTLPDDFVVQMLGFYGAKVNTTKDGDLAALKFGKAIALGTILNNGIVFMSYSRGAQWLPMEQLQSKIHGIWRLYAVGTVI